MSAKLLTQKYKSLGSFLLLSEQIFVVFGDPPNTDLICLGATKNKFSPSLYHSGVKQGQSVEACSDLVRNVKRLQQSDAVASFSISEATISVLKKAGGALDATHIRLHSERNNLRVMLFDCRTFDPSFRLQRKTTHKFRYLDVEIRMFQEFTSTLKLDSFQKLPMDDYDVRIGDNSITQFTPQKQSVTYLLRDQEIIEPMTVFHSERISQDIAFVFHPKSSLADQDASQSQLELTE